MTADKTTPRRGAALTEMAFLLPLLFLLVFGIIELGRAIMVKEILINVAREGARRAVLPDATDADALKVIDDYMTATKFQGYTRTISPSLIAIPPGTQITVTVSLPYDQVSWLPLGSLNWMSGKTLSAQAVMRREP